jgi:hypothetical protein
MRDLGMYCHGIYVCLPSGSYKVGGFGVRRASSRTQAKGMPWSRCCASDGCDLSFR